MLRDHPRSMPTNIPDSLRDTPGESTTQSKELALSEREYQLLLEACGCLDDPYALEARFVVLVCGRLGLRGGELAHMRESWIDWRDNMIRIPRQQNCTKGRDGGICGYCRTCAEQRLEHADDEALTEADVERFQWLAKTDAAERAVPFDFDPRAQLCIERFFDRFDEWRWSRPVVNRRLDRALEAADDLAVESTTPHGLRATAATFHAGRGLDALPLQAMMGWSELSTARNYVKMSGENTARALRQIHSR